MFSSAADDDDVAPRACHMTERKRRGERRSLKSPASFSRNSKNSNGLDRQQPVSQSADPFDCCTTSTPPPLALLDMQWSMSLSQGVSSGEEEKESI